MTPHGKAKGKADDDKLIPHLRELDFAARPGRRVRALDRRPSTAAGRIAIHRNLKAVERQWKVNERQWESQQKAVKKSTKGSGRSTKGGEKAEAEGKAGPHERAGGEEVLNDVDGLARVDGLAGVEELPGTRTHCARGSVLTSACSCRARKGCAANGVQCMHLSGLEAALDPCGWQPASGLCETTWKLPEASRVELVRCMSSCVGVQFVGAQNASQSPLARGRWTCCRLSIEPSRRRGCKSADTLSVSLVKHLLNGEEGAGCSGTAVPASATRTVGHARQLELLAPPGVRVSPCDGHRLAVGFDADPQKPRWKGSETWVKGQ